MFQTEYIRCVAPLACSFLFKVGVVIRDGKPVQLAHRLTPFSDPDFPHMAIGNAFYRVDLGPSAQSLYKIDDERITFSQAHGVDEIEGRGTLPLPGRRCRRPRQTGWFFPAIAASPTERAQGN